MGNDRRMREVLWPYDPIPFTADPPTGEVYWHCGGLSWRFWEGMLFVNVRGEWLPFAPLAGAELAMTFTLGYSCRAELSPRILRTLG